MGTKKVKVQVRGWLNRFVHIDPDATEGAVVDRNLRWLDGTVIKREDIDNAQVTPEQVQSNQVIGTGGGAQTGSGTPPQESVLWRNITEIPALLTALLNVATTGLLTKTGVSTIVTRAIQGVAGRISVSNGDGVSGNPSVDLAPVSQQSGGTLQVITIDSFGRISHSRPAIPDDLPNKFWPIVKNRIEASEAFTIPENFQLLCFGEFVFDGGELTIDGELAVVG